MSTNLVTEPDDSSASESISAKTLSEMDKAIRNFKLGVVSEEIDLTRMGKEEPNERKRH